MSREKISCSIICWRVLPRKFSQYSFLMKTLYGNYADEAVLNAKQVFLSEYGELYESDGTLKNKGISNWRGSAFNYFKQKPEDLWETENVAGAQKRIARLLWHEGLQPS